MDYADKTCLIHVPNWKKILFATTVWFLFCIFMIVIGWPSIIRALEHEQDKEYMKRVMIGISNTDKNCLQWQERSDNAWVCTRR